MFPKWFPSNLIKNLVVLGFVVFVGPLQAAPVAQKKDAAVEKKASKKIPELLLKVEENYQKHKTIEAAIEQVETVASLKTTKKNSGVIWIKIPNQFRWQIFSPERSTAVSDGKMFWVYTPPFDEEDSGQLIQRKSAEAKSQLLTALLSGSFSKTKGISIETVGEKKFKLIPKKGSAGKVVEALVEISPEKKQIVQVELKHKGGNLTKIKLSRIQLGKTLKEGLFTFKAPKNTEVVVK